MFPLSHMLKSFVRLGTLKVIDAESRVHVFGGRQPGPDVTMRLTDPTLYRSLFFNPELAAGEAYMDGRMSFEDSTLRDFLTLFSVNRLSLGSYPLQKALRTVSRGMKRFQQANPVGKAQKNVSHHYDIGNDFYGLFLDRGMQYSCAYFTSDDDTLEQAQQNKLRLIAAKLDLKPGQQVLDIGCGWGGLALYLARATGARVTGITLSDEQIKIARERAAAEAPERAPRFELCDYRAVEGPFDRIVSVGMFEHVGLPHYHTFFATVARLLAPGGTAVLHTIGRTDRPAGTNPFIARYIFPGGYIPALSEIMKAVEASGLIVSDVEVLRLHYAETLLAWRRRFLANRPAAVDIAGEEFCRMWEFYLAGSEAAFRFQNFVVFQVQLTRRIDTLPMTRDYMATAERALPLARPDGERPQGIAAGR